MVADIGSEEDTGLGPNWRYRENPMVNVMKILTVCTLALCAAVVFGCGTRQTRPESKIVPITMFKQVAGKWEGLSKRMPDMRNHAQVIMIINENGHFNFISDRGSGVLLGTGMLTILNGQVSGSSSSGTGTMTLHDKAGTSVLVLEAALNDGHHYYVEMTRMK
jgi:hypothetical protein